MSDSKPSILLVENNVFLGGILKERLKKFELELMTSRDGIDGLKELTKKTYSLIVLDLPLSDIVTFFGVMRHLASDKRIISPPVVILSNVETEKEIERISSLGAAAYLIKAYTDTDEIIEKIYTILKQNVTVELARASVEKDIEDHKKNEDDYSDRSRKEQSAKEIFEPIVDEHKKIKGDIEKIIILAEKNQGDDHAIISLVNNLIDFGSMVGASDIHFKPEKNELVVRMRIDGILRDVFVLPKKLHPEVISRLKVLSGMRTDEHQAAQDGRFRTDIKGIEKQFDVRTSIVPTYHGEDAVLRLLVEQSKIRNIDDIPFSKNDKEKVITAIRKPYGMILATGPTGSGKTTTLYTILKDLNTKDISIITIEDPIEYSLIGVNQIQVNNRTDLTFANGLRSILRQDPDVIMVGEIRDQETANISVNAALTGHKLLSTLHTNDAATTLPRLLDMGVEPFLIASTVNIAIGQRLIRRICDKCKKKKILTSAEKKNLSRFISKETLNNYKSFYQAHGCKECTDGYKSRLGIYEVLEVNDEIRDAIIKRKSANEIKNIAIKYGMTTLLGDGINKASQGLTTIEEILRVAQE